jgi:CIC family chloride channel protein
MFSGLNPAGARVRLILDRTLSSLGLGEDAFLVVAAFLIGMVTAAAAVGFHELIDLIRTQLYGRGGAEFLYGRGVWLIVALPACGGLAVGLFSRFVMREREGHGIIDVLESVTRSGGVIRPSSAIEKILTSAMTIGSGGSAGAEGPIVQIGAAIASGIGQFFRVARPHLPVLIGCGSAAGISAIFNSPIGGLLFTLEVVLRDFSVRTLTPMVIASVIANFTTQAIFRSWLHENYGSIFTMPADIVVAPGAYTLSHVGNFALLGVLCAAVGVTLTRLMLLTETRFAAIRIPRWLKPAIGGALLGLIGLAYVLVFGHLMLGRPKFIPFEQYSMPAFFGDGYGAVQPMLGAAFYHQADWGLLISVMLFLCIAKIIGTCLTLGSGGAGGIIAPSLFLGAVTGGALGMTLQRMGLSSSLEPHSYALIGMAAVLAAVVHAPLAAVLILVEATRDNQVIVPAMLVAITATAVARLLHRDSIYTASLRRRGVHVGSAGDLLVLRRISIEEVALEPATVVHAGDPLQRLLDLSVNDNATDFVVVDDKGDYLGLVVGEDIKRALLDREAVPLLLVAEVMRSDLPILRHTDDLASVITQFSAHDVSRLPVALPGNKARVIGLVSRAALMRRYQRALAQH